MEGSGLRIKINVIWDKKCKDGEVLAEIIYRYFCSSELSVIPNNIFSIPVRCYPIENYSKSFKCIAGYLTVNILLADNQMRLNDPDRILAHGLEEKDNTNHLYIPIALNRGGMEYIQHGEAISLYTGDQDELGNRIRDKLLKKLENLLTLTDKTRILSALRKVLERLAGKYFYLTGRSNDEQVRLFICHTKSTGAAELSAMQEYLAVETQDDPFVDRNTILYGQRLDEKIVENIKNRAMIVMWTDSISNREWCLKEIRTAKSLNMPVLVVDLLRFGDDCMYPYMGNCPVVKPRADMTKYNEKNRIEFEIIYESLINEILWNTYNLHKNDYGKNIAVLPRKPELQDLPELIRRKVKKVIYPEPPMGETERTIIDDLLSSLKYDVKFDTEISAQTKNLCDSKINVMISSSANANYMRVDENCLCVGINYAVKEISRYLIYMGCTILNAGNYEPDGFNRVILEQIMKYSKADDKSVRCVQYTNGYRKRLEAAKFEKFQNDYADARIEFRVCSDGVSTEKEALDLMREKITDDADIQLVIGGMYGTTKTGIEKEVELCIAKGKSVYLLGGFGFNTARLCNTYLTKEKVSELHNGLSLNENKRLAHMYDIGDILKLIIKGWNKTKGNK